MHRFYLVSFSFQGNKTWTTTVHIVQGVNSTGLFTLVLSYVSASRVSTWISVGSNSGVVSLESCSQRCYQNLSAVLGEMPLTGSVVINVTYNASIVDFTPVDVVAIPQEFYQATLLKNSTRQDFLANCSVIDNDMGIGTVQEEFCLVQVFSLTVNYLGGALRMFKLLVCVFLHVLYSSALYVQFIQNMLFKVTCMLVVKSDRSVVFQ